MTSFYIINPPPNSSQSSYGNPADDAILVQYVAEEEDKEAGLIFWRGDQTEKTNGRGNATLKTQSTTPNPTTLPPSQTCQRKQAVIDMTNDSLNAARPERSPQHLEHSSINHTVTSPLSESHPSSSLTVKFLRSGFALSRKSIPEFKLPPLNRIAGAKSSSSKPHLDMPSEEDRGKSETSATETRRRKILEGLAGGTGLRPQNGSRVVQQTGKIEKKTSVASTSRFNLGISVAQVNRGHERKGSAGRREAVLKAFASASASTLACSAAATATATAVKETHETRTKSTNDSETPTMLPSMSPGDETRPDIRRIDLSLVDRRADVTYEPKPVKRLPSNAWADDIRKKDDVTQGRMLQMDHDGRFLAPESLSKTRRSGKESSKLGKIVIKRNGLPTSDGKVWSSQEAREMMGMEDPDQVGYDGKPIERDGKRTTKEEEVKDVTFDEVNKHVLTTLKERHNPITHSDLYGRTSHVVSAASGHQVSNRAGGSNSISEKDYLQIRSAKLAEQARAVADDQRPTSPSERMAVPVGGRFAAELARERSRSRSESGSACNEGNEEREIGNLMRSRIFAGCNFYINGYTGEHIGDLELKKLIAVHGGNVHQTPGSTVTYILVTSNLSGSKSDKFLRASASSLGKKKKVVKVQWVLDSVKANKRLSENRYTVLANEGQPTLATAFGMQQRKRGVDEVDIIDVDVDIEGASGRQTRLMGKKLKGGT